MSEYEKALLPDETIDRLSALLTQLGDYRIVKGNGSSWAKESGGELTFTANGPYGKFTGVKIDGTALDAENYTVESGSTVLTLKLVTYAHWRAGQHTITILYTDGEAAGAFTVAEGPVIDGSASLGRGCNIHLFLWLLLLLILAIIIWRWIAKRRDKEA